MYGNLAHEVGDFLRHQEKAKIDAEGSSRPSDMGAEAGWFDVTVQDSGPQDVDTIVLDLTFQARTNADEDEEQPGTPASKMRFWASRDDDGEWRVERVMDPAQMWRGALSVAHASLRESSGDSVSGFLNSYSRGHRQAFIDTLMQNVETESAVQEVSDTCGFSALTDGGFLATSVNVTAIPSMYFLPPHSINAQVMYRQAAVADKSGTHWRLGDVDSSVWLSRVGDQWIVCALSTVSGVPVISDLVDILSVQRPPVMCPPFSFPTAI